MAYILTPLGIFSLFLAPFFLIEAVSTNVINHWVEWHFTTPKYDEFLRVLFTLLGSDDIAAINKHIFSSWNNLAFFTIFKTTVLFKTELFPSFVVDAISAIKLNGAPVFREVVENATKAFLTKKEILDLNVNNIFHAVKDPGLNPNTIIKPAPSLGPHNYESTIFSRHSCWCLRVGVTVSCFAFALASWEVSKMLLAETGKVAIKVAVEAVVN